MKKLKKLTYCLDKVQISLEIVNKYGYDKNVTF